MILGAAAHASDAAGHSTLHATSSTIGIVALILFAVAYAAVIGEEYLHLRKSKPVILSAGILWALAAIIARSHGEEAVAGLNEQIGHTTLEFAELFLFLLVAMTYINAMTEHKVFEALRCWLSSRGFSYRSLFWITGTCAFFISPVADNLTTAMLMGAVIISLAGDKPKIVGICFINIVVAANAGGAFSPFGDITTLMVWQAGKVNFFEFFRLFLPSAVNFLVPAVIMCFALPAGAPTADGEKIKISRGGKRICGLFLATLVIAICFKQVLHLPPFLGMMTGLSLLLLFGFYLRKNMKAVDREQGVVVDIFDKIERAEWDTLFFFFGVMYCVGALGYIGYLEIAASKMYGLGHTEANIIAGLLSAVIDNIPVMFGVLRMDPDMTHYQWLLVTLTAGVGGSLLSVGSAAGVALMGQARGKYTFLSHLKWSWAVALGYVASIATHWLVNGALDHPVTAVAAKAVKATQGI